MVPKQPAPEFQRSPQVSQLDERRTKEELATRIVASEQDRMEAIEAVLVEAFGPDWYQNDKPNMLSALAGMVLIERRHLGQFRRHVDNVARRYAIRYGWCDEVRACLREMGIEMAEPRYTAKVTVTYEFTGTVPYDHIKSMTEDGPGFISRHLHVPSLVVEGEGFLVSEMIDPIDVTLVNYDLAETS